MNGLDLGIGGGLRLGGDSSPMVVGASTAGSPTAATSAYGAGSTSGSGNVSSLFGSSPGHITIHAGILAFALLILIRHSLPK